MILSRATLALAASATAAFLLLAATPASAQSCPPGDANQCAFDPANPHSCGAGYSCAYANICLAETAGFDIDADCCQSPQPSMCPMILAPVECGSKKCPYANDCLASLAGYSSSQCSPAPPECPTSSKDCSGEPANPYTCGSTRCEYGSICEAEGAGFNIRSDCCQDTRTSGACSTILAPVSCGPPGGKQCVYDSQCLADAAGYNPMQCCNAVPDNVACPSSIEPVQCGNIPCVFNNQCEADAAGYSESECCRQAPADTACPMDYEPVMCGRNSCTYNNECLANSAGYDFNSCVPAPQASAQAAGTMSTMAMDEGEPTTLPEGGDATTLPECTCEGENGEMFCPGDSFTAPDGCNTCTCTGGPEGIAACTAMACPEEPTTLPECTCEGEDGEMYCPGDSYKVACNTCTCSETGVGACTMMACPDEPTTLPECTCEGENGEMFCPGDSYTAPDGCNTCTCNDDGVGSCTKMACPEEPEVAPMPATNEEADPDNNKKAEPVPENTDETSAGNMPAAVFAALAVAAATAFN